jgi:hypothetical protein
MHILLKVADDQVLKNHSGHPNHMLFLPWLICKLV